MRPRRGWRSRCLPTAGCWPDAERYTDKKHSVMRLASISVFFLLAVARPGTAQPYTWSEHIAPIIYNNCTSCHRPGQVSPLPLMNYDDVRRRGSLVAETVHMGYMPPWKPEPGWAAYRDERRLTPAQIDMLTAWVDGDMP